MLSQKRKKKKGKRQNKHFFILVFHKVRQVSQSVFHVCKCYLTRYNISIGSGKWMSPIWGKCNCVCVGVPVPVPSLVPSIPLPTALLRTPPPPSLLLHVLYILFCMSCEVTLSLKPHQCQLALNAEISYGCFLEDSENKCFNALFLTKNTLSIY